MGQQLLIESVSATEGSIITETATNGKDVWLSGVFMQANIQNRNGRNYPVNEMHRAVEQMNSNIKAYGGVFGELDHPTTLTINMDRISHVITEVRMVGNDVVGKARILDTPMGLIAKELAKSGVRYGVSSRGAGTVNESGLVSNFNIITVDLVATPSAMGAYPTPVYEGLQDYKGGRILTLAESVKNDDKAQIHLRNEITKFVQSILKK